VKAGIRLKLFPQIPQSPTGSVVLGRFRDSIPHDSILLATFAGEREVKESIQACHEFFTKMGNKNEPFKSKLSKKALKTRNFVRPMTQFFL
jgi:hypothetical protein